MSKSSIKWIIIITALLAGVAAIFFVMNRNKPQEDGGTIEDPENIAVFVDKAERLASAYVPPDLTVCNVKAVNGIAKDAEKLRKEAATALEEMFRAGEAEGMALYIESGYRSYEHQMRTYESMINAKGEEYTSKYIAMPGHSEHQTGLAMDITNIDHMDDDHEKLLGTMKEGIWLRDNAHRFGFILRYPEGKTAITGYNYEPWHFRYVGIETATEIFEMRLTLDEYMTGK